MTSVELNVRFWLAGLVAGLILMARWRRQGARDVPVADLGSDVNAPAASTASTATKVTKVTTATTATTDKPSASALILSGAKADAIRARRSLDTLITRVGSKARLPVPAQRSGDS